MPYVSERQRRYMHAQHPEIAARWDAKYGVEVKSSTSRVDHASTRGGKIRRKKVRRKRNHDARS